MQYSHKNIEGFTTSGTGTATSVNALFEIIQKLKLVSAPTKTCELMAFVTGVFYC